ncbi:MAG: molybdopterin-binding protein [Lachnospirales bacterium]
MNKLNPISLHEAHKIIDNIEPLKINSTTVATTTALNKFSSKNIASKVNIPEYNRSLVDGYGVKSEDIKNASENTPVTLKLVDSVEMGKVYNSAIENGQCLYITTGGYIPDSVDTMVMVEDTKTENNNVEIFKKSEPNNKIINIGDDIKKETIICAKGEKITPYKMGVLLACGIKEIEIYKPLNIAIISTGEELVSAEKEKNFGEIYDVNGPVIKNLIEEKFSANVVTEIIKEENELDSLLEKYKNFNYIFVSGGSSVGKKDFTFHVIKKYGEILINGIYVKPGKPTIVAKSDSSIIVGLPGHISSAILIYKIFMEKHIYKTLSNKANSTKVKGKLKGSIVAEKARDTYSMVYYENGEITPISSKSGMVSILDKGNGYVLVEKGKELTTDQCTDVTLL